MPDINCSMRASLLEKTIMMNGEMRNIYGLQSLRTSPKRHGLGRWSLIAFESIADRYNKYAIVGFVEPSLLVFYLQSGWYTNGVYEGQHVISNVHIESIIVTEKW